MVIFGGGKRWERCWGKGTTAGYTALSDFDVSI